MVMRHVDPHPSLRAELAVQMLTTVLVNDRKVLLAFMVSLSMRVGRSLHICVGRRFIFAFFLSEAQTY